MSSTTIPLPTLPEFSLKGKVSVVTGGARYVKQTNENSIFFRNTNTY
jgi:hypothetical protein